MYEWWKKAVVYEIYCKSFCDSNGDGIGDLGGVISKLPVLKELGIDCIWFTPIYTSPQVDNGYDVADYQNIHKDYGTLEDLRRLVDLAHGMGIRIIMDMVLNHSSDEHFWFRESRKSKDNPYRNYYIWQPPKADGSEPNNWGNRFRDGNGSAWEFDPQTGEYYLHQYAVKMPDLNWEYEPLRQEIYRMLRWWLDFGIDGFRLDVFTRFKKPAGFPDTDKAPDLLLDRNGYILDSSMCTCVEGIHEFLHEMYTEVFGPSGCFTVGEGTGINAENALSYIAPERGEVSTVYHFTLASRKQPPFTTEKYRRIQQAWADLIPQGGWPVQYLSNHDSARQVSRYGDERYRVPSAKLLAALTLTAPGTPFLYQGEEIGMVDVHYDSIEDHNCCYTVGDYHAMVASGTAPQEALRILAPKSRDNARTPYQWDGSPHAGFTTGKPWLKVNPVYPQINLEADRASEDSIFAFYQKAIRLHREQPAILEGDLRFIWEDHPQLIAYLRRCEKQTVLVIANKSSEPAAAVLPEEIAQKKWTLLLENLPQACTLLEKTEWQPWECCIYEME
ncbi:MAG: alpha-glucosidase [Oscillospiraceae bacterium]|nr:alpha-glucosidase [Oscillospiraceae bacterium]